MMPDSSKYYVANFLDSTITVITIDKTHGTPTPKVSATINLLGDAAHGITKYDPIILGAAAPVGALPIQLPVSPDGKYMVVANTLAANILVFRTSDDQLVATLTCDAGCHGVQWGAKQGGGYYAYVSSKFSNRLLVVDPGNVGTDAAIVGSVLLTTANKSSHFHTDGTENKYEGMGGQGVLPIPLVYNGWVQNLPGEWKEKLTKQQLNPFPTH
jgi:DNA-binding beta-propeller fold protein YncE